MNEWIDDPSGPYPLLDTLIYPFPNKQDVVVGKEETNQMEEALFLLVISLVMQKAFGGEQSSQRVPLCAPERNLYLHLSTWTGRLNYFPS